MTNVINVRTRASSNVMVGRDPTATVVKEVRVGVPIRRVDTSSGNLLEGAANVRAIDSIPEGALLIFDAAEQEWVVTVNVETGQDINGGSY